MDTHTDPIAIIGTACRLPGSVHTLAQLWPLLCKPVSTSTPPPASRGFETIMESDVVRAGWLPPSSLEAYDPEFFRITPGEADYLRPNIRLAFELTYEAFQNAGIDPSSLKGRNVSVNIAMGTEDGWEIKRFAEDGPDAFDNNWAQNSDPSAVPGRVAHFFDFQGPVSSVSSACASGGNALDSGIQSLYSQGSEIAVVGATTTHLAPAAFQWASSVNVASKNGRCSAFSVEADGYVPSEGAVFIVLQRASRAIPAGRKIDGFIRGLTLRHSGYTRTLSTPNPIAQKALIEATLKKSKIKQEDVVLLETHGTGTRLGDMIEIEAIKGVFGSARSPRATSNPLVLSSSKTVLGHTQAAAALTGVLKVLLCFKHHIIPPHGVKPTNDLLKGPIIIPTSAMPISNDKPFIALVSSFGFTGGIASIILQDYRSTLASINAPFPAALKAPHPPDCTNDRWLLPFSAKNNKALEDVIKSTRAWILPPSSPRSFESNSVDLSISTLEPGAGEAVTIRQLAYLLATAREHFPVRKAFVAESIQDFLDLSADRSKIDGIDRTVEKRSVDAARASLETSGDFDIKDSGAADALALAFLQGKTNTYFEHAYRNIGITVPSSLLDSFPLYPFQREYHWKISQARSNQLSSKTAPNAAFTTPTIDAVSSLIAKILCLPKDIIFTSETNILDLGMNSLNSIELASLLTKTFGRQVDTNRLYQLTLFKDILALLTEEHTQSERTDSVRQTELETLVQKFIRDPLEVYDILQDASGVEHEDAAPIVLLTGATGFLGARTLDHLLRFLPENVHIACLVRGDAVSRLISSFDKWGLSTTSLSTFIASSRVLPISTSDISESYLGASESEYKALLLSVRVIVHLAWSVDFNKPPLSFQDDIQGTRNLAQLAAKSKHRIALHFTTSFSSTFGYTYATYVPERPLELDITYALDQGYAVSKMAAEHMLYHLAAQEGANFEAHIVRIGQISGDSSTGEWSIDEMIPMMMASLAVLGAVPKELPNVSWIPVDTCAQVIGDLIAPNFTTEGNSNSNSNNVFVYNVTNPQEFDWKATVDLFAQAARLPLPRIVNLKDYVSLIQKAQEKYGGRTATCVPVVRLLASFIGGLDGKGWLSHYALLDVSLTQKISPSLAACLPIDSKMANLLMGQIMKRMHGSANPFKDSSQQSLGNSLAMDIHGSSNYVLIFGPWSDLNEKLVTTGVMDIWARLQKTAVSVVDEVFEKHSWLNMQNKDILHQGHSFNRMLLTLALQLYNFDQFTRKGIRPCALIGYCFGEYAASIVGGYMTEKEAVDVLTRRSLAISQGARLKNENEMGKPGAMLNVFTSLDVVRRHVVLLPEPVAEIAIHAGPSHTILSGNIEVITRAQELFKASGVRTIPVSTDIPFHSREMDSAVDFLTMITADYPSFTRSETTTQYISGLTGRTLPSSGITIRYWVRHMRERVRFLECMKTVQTQSIGSSSKMDGPVFLDVGPSGTLKKMISRYQWDGLVCEQSDVYLKAKNITITVVQHQAPTSSPSLKETYPSSDFGSKSLVVSSPSAASLVPSSITRKTDRAGEVCLALLSRLFDYPQDNINLLQQTFHLLGLGSLDFVQLQSEFKAVMGVTFPPSSYASDQPISEIIQHLE